MLSKMEHVIPETCYNAMQQTATPSRCYSRYRGTAAASLSAYFHTRISNDRNMCRLIPRLSHQTRDPHASYIMCVDRLVSDIIGAAYTNNHILYWMNHQNNTFSLEPNIISITLQSHPTTIFVIDMNNDNHIDIIIGSLSSSDIDDPIIIWYENHLINDGFTEHFIETSLDDIYMILSVDLTSDGETDIIVSTESSQGVWWFDNIGAEQFGAERLVIMRCCAANIDACDLTNSGYVDIIIGWAASISWFVNNGDKTFG